MRWRCSFLLAVTLATLSPAAVWGQEATAAAESAARGPLSEAGVVAAAEAINAKRALLRKVCVILESSESELLADFVKLLYRRVTVADQPADTNGSAVCAASEV